MDIEKGKKYLVTLKEWFIAPDGEYYKAIFGKVSRMFYEEEAVKKNCYVKIGDITVRLNDFTCSIKTNKVSMKRPVREMTYEGKLHTGINTFSRIYKA